MWQGGGEYCVGGWWGIGKEGKEYQEGRVAECLEGGQGESIEEGTVSGERSWEWGGGLRGCWGRPYPSNSSGALYQRVDT